MLLNLKPISVVIIFLCIAFVIGFHAQAQTESSGSQCGSDSIAVQIAIANFLQAFDNLDWDRFVKCFDRNATVFFPPSAHTPRRADGIVAIETVFKVVFDNIRAGRQIPPFQDIQPIDSKIQMLHETAIVTFHLNDEAMWGRRTVVFQRIHGAWLIVHLHASAIETKR